MEHGDDDTQNRAAGTHVVHDTSNSRLWNMRWEVVKRNLTPILLTTTPDTIRSRHHADPTPFILSYHCNPAAYFRAEVKHRDTGTAVVRNLRDHPAVRHDVFVLSRRELHPLLLCQCMIADEDRVCCDVIPSIPPTSTLLGVCGRISRGHKGGRSTCESLLSVLQQYPTFLLWWLPRFSSQQGFSSPTSLVDFRLKLCAIRTTWSVAFCCLACEVRLLDRVFQRAARFEPAPQPSLPISMQLSHRAADEDGQPNGVDIPEQFRSHTTAHGSSYRTHYSIQCPGGSTLLYFTRNKVLHREFGRVVRFSCAANSFGPVARKKSDRRRVPIVYWFEVHRSRNIFFE